MGGCHGLRERKRSKPPGPQTELPEVTKPEGLVRRSVPVVRVLQTLALTLLVEACAVQDLGPPKHPAPGPPSEARGAPLVLRPGPVAVHMQAPIRSGYGPGLGEEVLWLSVTALLTFGAPLLDLPHVLARHQTTEWDLPKECAQSWDQVVSQEQWLGSSETRTSALKALAEAMTWDLERRGRTLAIEIEPTFADDPRAMEALASMGSRLSAPAIAVADVLLSIEAQPKKCAMLLRVSANLHLEKLHVEPKSQVLGALSQAGSLSVTQWAKDPGLGTRTLQTLLGQLGRDIVTVLPASASPPQGGAWRDE
ncbi:hypothetical protein BurJ1DRAFT_3492 [Burkholderiales bacterium JOSHI_001]|nr:hypothetical protein BurJ1DRAFT_3492 [Burkholderiales bacterium JOSHI_001]